MGEEFLLRSHQKLYHFFFSIFSTNLADRDAIFIAEFLRFSVASTVAFNFSDRSFKFCNQYSHYRNLLDPWLPYSSSLLPYLKCHSSSLSCRHTPCSRPIDTSRSYNERYGNEKRRYWLDTWDGSSHSSHCYRTTRTRVTRFVCHSNEWIRRVFSCQLTDGIEISRTCPSRSRPYTREYSLEEWTCSSWI